jgi:hypothetical protein
MRLVRMVTAAVVAGGLLTGSAADAQQRTYPERGFITVIAGTHGIPALTASTDFNVSGDERSSVRTSRPNASALFVDIAGAKNITPHIAVGAAVLHSTIEQFISYTAALPQSVTGFPVFEVSDVYPDAQHQETQIHFSGHWIVPFNNKVALDFSGGPSLFLVNHDSIVSITTRPLYGYPVISRDSEKVLGLHAGGEVRAAIVRQVGLAVRVRYARANADYSTGRQTVGGLQVGAGLALIF